MVRVSLGRRLGEAEEQREELWRAWAEKSDGSGEQLRIPLLGSRNLNLALSVPQHPLISPSIAGPPPLRIPPASSPALSSPCCPARLPVGLRSGLSASRPPANLSAAASLAARPQDPSSISRAMPRASSTPAETLPALPRRWPSSPKPEHASKRCPA